MTPLLLLAPGDGGLGPRGSPTSPGTLRFDQAALLGFAETFFSICCKATMTHVTVWRSVKQCENCLAALHDRQRTFKPAELSNKVSLTEHLGLAASELVKSIHPSIRARFQFIINLRSSRYGQLSGKSVGAVRLFVCTGWSVQRVRWWGNGGWQQDCYAVRSWARGCRAAVQCCSFLS